MRLVLKLSGGASIEPRDIEAIVRTLLDENSRIELLTRIRSSFIKRDGKHLIENKYQSYYLCLEGTALPASSQLRNLIGMYANDPRPIVQAAWADEIARSQEAQSTFGVGTIEQIVLSNLIEELEQTRWFE